MGLIKLFAVGALASIGALGIGTLTIVGYLFTGGVASVQVDTPDTDLYIPVPLRLADLALGAAALAAPEHELADARAELDEYTPLMRQLAEELGRMPDGEFVRVEAEDQLVIVGQHRGHFQVQVDAPDSHVRVTMPRRAARRLLGKSLELVDQ